MRIQPSVKIRAVPKGAKGINWRGTYSASTVYVVDDAVAYLGSSYICILNSTGNVPTNTTYWDTLATKGTDGAGGGDVVGPDSAVNENFVSFNSTTGKLVKDSGNKASDFYAVGGTDVAIADGGTGAGTAAAAFAALKQAATSSATGVSELAIASELNTGTDDTRSVTPDALAGSNFGIRYVQITCFDYTVNTATGDGKGYFVVPAGLNGMNLVSVHAKVITAGTTNTTDIQIANVTQAADMLTTKITIDSTETGSDTAATPAVIDANNDDIATADLIRVDVDAVHTTPAKGMLISLGFALP